MERAQIVCSGVVQGVGFRPFVYRIATRSNLTGYVLNMGDAGVKIIVEGKRSDIDRFLNALRAEKPPRASLERVTVTLGKYTGSFGSFQIRESSREHVDALSTLPPDIAICDSCLQDLSESSTRFYKYPFTSCQDCGPRFAVVTELPYDRANTTLESFPLCGDCLYDYSNPASRRFRAEGIVCPKCGPRYKLYGKGGQEIAVEDPIQETCLQLDRGAIVAIKGVGGIHLACSVTNDGVLKRLRENRKQSDKPFAIMSRDLQHVTTFAEVPEEARVALSSWRRPIVILKKKEPFPLSNLLSPGLDTIGVMLPYSGVHHMLLDNISDPALVMTSANLPGKPMIIDNQDALRLLGSIADFFLLHNREIANRCDDSVIKVMDRSFVFVRRSRGYVPESFLLPNGTSGCSVALGAEENTSAAVVRDNRCYPTQFLGDMGTRESVDALESSIRHMMKLLGRDSIDLIACDLHPSFETTRFAYELSTKENCDVVRVQHHHAHAASLMVERNLDSMVAITADGFGYGPDGSAWGGEILLTTLRGFERFGHLKPQLMPGGDLCAKFPARMVASVLRSRLEDRELRKLLLSLPKGSLPGGAEEIDMVLLQLDKKLLSPTSTSAGRFLDAAAALLGICSRRTYEGEPAMKLEAAASSGNPEDAPLSQTITSGEPSLDTSELLYEAFLHLRSGRDVADIAAAIEQALAQGLAYLAVDAATNKGLNVIGFTGGVALNRHITATIRGEVERAGLKFVINNALSPGDNGLSVGQAAVALAAQRGGKPHRKRRNR
jgi:hydrogenase maturation protein HypF